jgi:small subunit ribosomal protein S5
MVKKEKGTEELRKAEKRLGQEEKIEKRIEPKLSEEERMKERERERRKNELEKWVPKTQLGKDVRDGKIKKIDEIFKQNIKILESEIVDILLPNIEFDLINVGQAKGKFGGGKRRPWRQTQKKTAEGNVPTFGCVVVVGNRDGYVGLGHGKAKETVPAKLKAIRNAKLNIMFVARGCGSFECTCKEPHSIPFKTEGKCSSARVILIPAPKGTGLVIDDECKKILRLAGIKDIYSKTFGQTRTKFNLSKAIINALKKLNA